MNKVKPLVELVQSPNGRNLFVKLRDEFTEFAIGPFDGRTIGTPLVLTYNLLLRIDELRDLLRKNAPPSANAFIKGRGRLVGQSYVEANAPIQFYQIDETSKFSRCVEAYDNPSIAKELLIEKLRKEEKEGYEKRMSQLSNSLPC